MKIILCFETIFSSMGKINYQKINNNIVETQVQFDELKR